MMRCPLLGLSACMLVAALGCRAKPKGPEVDPPAAGKAAIAKYDANGDGKIDRNEAKKCPSLLVAFDRVDSDKDGALSADEITSRIKGWLSSGVNITNGSARVTLDGKNLADADVILEPEEFLGPGFKPSSGKSDAHGHVSMQGHDAKFPGIYLGLYRIRVSKKVNGKETIPSRYNTESEIGYEVATDLPNIQSVIPIVLKNK